MGRPHIEFIFAQALNWHTGLALDNRGELAAKLLSQDEASGELTAIVRVPAGWQASVTSEFQEELYVLDGAIAIDGQRHARDGYVRLPSGVAHQWRSDGDCVVILFRNAASAHDEERLVAIDSTAIDWDRSGIPPELDYMGIALKPLFVDPRNGRNRTWLLTVQPQVAPRGDALAVETHSCAEEVFMLSGDITGPQGAMTAGAYFWRPRDVLHGPFGSRNGGLALSRWRHGDQDTIFHGQRRPFDFAARYRPDLPATMAHLVQHVPAEASRF